MAAEVDQQPIAVQGKVKMPPQSCSALRQQQCIFSPTLVVLLMWRHALW